MQMASSSQASSHLRINQDVEIKPWKVPVQVVNETGMGYICPLAGDVWDQVSYIKLLHSSQEVFQAEWKKLGSFQRAAAGGNWNLLFLVIPVN